MLMMKIYHLMEALASYDDMVKCLSHDMTSSYNNMIDHLQEALAILPHYLALFRLPSPLLVIVVIVRKVLVMMVMVKMVMVKMVTVVVLVLRLKVYAV